MPIMQDEDGDLWEVDAAGNVVGPVAAPAAPAGQVFSLPPNPRDVAVDADRRADNARADRAADRADTTASVANELKRAELAIKEKELAREGKTGKQIAEWRGNLENIGLLERTIADLRQQYDANFKGKGLLQSSAEKWAPGDFAPQYAVFDTTAQSMLADMAKAKGLTAQQFNTPAEQRMFFEPLIPKRGDPDEVITAKLDNLERMVATGRRTTEENLGVSQQRNESELDKAAATGFEAPPNDGSPPGLPPANAPGGQDTTPLTVASGGSRNVPLPRANALVNSLMSAGASKAMIDAALAKQNLPPISFRDYSAAKKWMQANPGKRYNAANLTRPENLTLMERAAGSTLGAGAANYADAATAGISTALAGDQGRGALDAMNATSPNASAAGSILGGITGALASELAAMKLLGGLPRLAARSGDAVYGGATGFNAADEGNGAVGALGGAAAGALGGYVGEKVAAPAADALMRTQGGQMLSQAVRAGVNKVRPGTLPDQAIVPQFTPDEASIARISRGDAFDQAINNVREADALGLPYALADADPKLRALGGSVSRKSPNARELAEQTFEPRHHDQADRAMRGVQDILAPPVDIAARQREWRNTANERARPLYEEAFQGGSTAPLETQLADAFHVSSKAVADARAALAQAQRDATLASAQVSRAGDNVYQNAKALPNNRNANSAIEGAQQRLTQAEAQHEQVLEQLRRSQGDAASNAPGAVWNPRLQQFIDDPLSKAGMARGLEIQRLEALAEGRPFNPTEYAIVGTDQAGNPVVGNVPNLRTLDALKKGYDAILDEYPRDMKGNQIFDQRGRAITMAKQALVKELDDVTGGELGPYASARNTYGTYAQLGQTLREGYDAAPKGTYARDLQTRLGGMDEPNLGEFRQGYATRLRDTIGDTNDNADPYRLIYGGNERRAKMAAVFPEGEPQFGRLYGLEQDMAKTRQETLGGSQTAGRLAADEMFDGPGMTALDAGAQLATGGGFSPAGALKLGARMVGDNWRLGLGQKKADALAPVLFNPNPRAVLDYIDELGRKQAEDEMRKAAFRRNYGLAGAGTLGPLLAGIVAQ